MTYTVAHPLDEAFEGILVGRCCIDEKVELTKNST